MQVDVSTEIAIQRPRSEVAAFAIDPDNVPRWYENIKSVRWETEPPLRIGSRIAFVAEFLGHTLSYTYQVVELAPGSRFVMETAEGPFPMQTTYEFVSLGEDATQMTMRNRGDAYGFSMLLAPFMSFAIRRANKKDLLRLKQVLEEAPMN